MSSSRLRRSGVLSSSVGVVAEEEAIFIIKK